MKLLQPFKTILWFTLVLLYGTGVLVYVLATWFQSDRGMGPEPSPWQLTSLQVHSITGLLFLIFFGYLWATHILPGWRRRRLRGTGALMTGVCIVLMLTVPILFYSTHEEFKNLTGLVHTYLGLASILPFLLHLAVGRSL